jgi:speckle-type POZ protein
MSDADGSKPKPSLLFTSAIVADPKRASHLLKIDGYDHTKASFPNGKFLESVPFTVGGHRWCIRYFPNGNNKDTASYISLFLALKDSFVDEPVRVQYEFNFADDEAEEEDEELVSASYDCSHDCDGYPKFIRRSGFERSEYLRDDAFTIRCDMIVVKFRPEPDEATTSAAVPVPPSNLQAHLRDLLETQQGADVVFQVGGETLEAHRWMFAVRSPVFNAELFGAMKEGSTGVVV